MEAQLGAPGDSALLQGTVELRAVDHVRKRLTRFVLETVPGRREEARFAQRGEHRWDRQVEALKGFRTHDAGADDVLACPGAAVEKNHPVPAVGQGGRAVGASGPRPHHHDID